ncbi:MAG: hypothetical protein KJP00_07120, partial [Bacteroidia bacterium]|nr:hypothetical protein [Bacteroidia bacterium]
VLVGIITGMVIPFVAYAIILMGYELADAQGWFSQSSVTENFRARTIGILAISANLITIHYFRRKRQDNSMRGVVIATAIYIMTWLILFGSSFFS